MVDLLGARKLKLPSLKTYFDYTGGTGPRNSNTNEISLEETKGVSWEGTSCTEQDENTDCDDQSEGGTETGVMSHVGL